MEAHRTGSSAALALSGEYAAKFSRPELQRLVGRCGSGVPDCAADGPVVPQGAAGRGKGGCALMERVAVRESVTVAGWAERAWVARGECHGAPSMRVARSKVVAISLA